MKRFLRTFYGKLSAVFLLLLLLMGVIQIYITLNATTSFHSEADQKLHLRLATDVAAEFRPLLKDSIDYEGIHHQIHYMMVINPNIEIYLLDGNGKILAFFAEPQKKVKAQYVNLNPIRDFLNGETEMPIWGEDPRHPGRKKTFSVAPVQIGDDINGYLYIIIGSEQYDTASSAIREGYIVETTVIGLLITLVFTGIIGLILFAFLTRRIRKMSKVVNEFENGKLDKRVPEKSGDELGYLANSFNKMADTIVANMEDLKKTDDLRRELVANVSHDLRSPLATIKGYLETIQIKDGNLSEEERQKYMSIILNITENLEKLAEQLFELSKLDMRDTATYLEPFSIADLVQDVLMKYKPVAETSNINLEVRLPESLPQVYADVGLIERVLSNLMENALRYTPQEGRITIEISQEQDNMRVAVEDTGCGIEEDELPHIFDRFYRVEKSRARATGGSGLGLAIVKKIMEIHNTSISVDSQVNVGTRFSFTLEVWKQPIPTG